MSFVCAEKQTKKLTMMAFVSFKLRSDNIAAIFLFSQIKRKTFRCYLSKTYKAPHQGA